MICSIIFLPLQGSALELQETNQQQIMTGSLVSDYGNIEEVSGHLINTKTYSVMGDKADILEKTYAFDLYSRANYTLTAEEMDGSYSVRVYLTIEYTTQNTPTEYLLTNVSGHWEILDSLVSVTDAELNYGCSGRYPSSTVQNGTKNVNNYFDYDTGFTDYVVDDGYWGQLGANINLDLQMGSSRTWEFLVQNILFN